MALIRCPECSAQVSTNALACPSCGYPISKLTNLHDAVHSNKASLVGDLLKIGAEVEARDKKGRTPLMIAAGKGNIEIVTILLQAGANPGYVNSLGETALTIAARKRKKDVARILRQALIEGVTSARKKNLLVIPITPPELPEKKKPEPVLPEEQNQPDSTEPELVEYQIQSEFDALEPVLVEEPNQSDLYEPELVDFDTTQVLDFTESVESDAEPPARLNGSHQDKQQEERLHCLECKGSIAPDDIKCPHCAALIVRRYCSHCSKLIPEHASVCSFCGRDGSEHFHYSQHPEAKWISGAIAVLFLVLIFVVIWHAPTQQQETANNTVPTNEPVLSEPEEPAAERMPGQVGTPPAPEPASELQQSPAAIPTESAKDSGGPARRPSGNTIQIRNTKTKRTTVPKKVNPPKIARTTPPPSKVDESVVQEWEASVADPDLTDLTNQEREKRGRKLNNQGYTLLKSGKVKEAIPLLEQSVRSFPKETKDPYYGYALFNLARALRITGRPDLAIPLLEQRIKINDQREVVARELQAAKRQAGDSTDNIQYQ